VSHPENDSLLVVIVNFRTPELTAECLRSLAPEARLHGARAIVVDGGSGDGSAESLARAIEERGYGDFATLLPLDRNGGFAYANDAALAGALAGPARPRFVYLLNPDTVVFPGALTALLSFMREHPSAGIAGSRCENADGTVRRTAFRFHSALGELESEAAIGPLSRALRAWAVAPPVRDTPHRADWVSGAAMLVRSEVFDAIGLLDDGYFLYYEETDFARRAAAAGFECWYVPASRVLHYCGQASGVTRSDGSIGRVPPYFHESRRRYFVKHHGRAYAIAADLAWLAGSLLRRLRRLAAGSADPHPRGRVRDLVRHNVPHWLAR
jgi:GT2 family glycosyltransferase